jgi:hypothetical protein
VLQSFQELGSSEAQKLKKNAQFKRKEEEKKKKKKKTF